jgi:hypothetical protein
MSMRIPGDCNFLYFGVGAVFGLFWLGERGYHCEELVEILVEFIFICCRMYAYALSLLRVWRVNRWRFRDTIFAW